MRNCATDRARTSKRGPRIRITTPRAFLEIRVNPMDATTALAPYLPLLRRYARALTKSSSSADHYIRATLSILLVEPTAPPEGLSPRAALYAVFHRIWSSVPHDYDLPAGVSSTARAAVLLMMLESFRLDETAAILEIPAMDLLCDVLEAHRALKSRLQTQKANCAAHSQAELRSAAKRHESTHYEYKRIPKQAPPVRGHEDDRDRRARASRRPRQTQKQALGTPPLVHYA
jgi:DNA-directed RNA polymerase specialized sigma24 family protein